MSAPMVNATRWELVRAKDAALPALALHGRRSTAPERP
jgi:hypothetical protein